MAVSTFNIVIGLEPDIAKQLLYDAIGEFIDARTPVEKYVSQRYADQTPEFRYQKIKEVRKRLIAAENILIEDTTTITKGDILRARGAKDLPSIKTNPKDLLGLPQVKD